MEDGSRRFRLGFREEVSAHERLSRYAARAETAIREGTRTVPSAFTLRSDQMTVFASFSAFLRESCLRWLERQEGGTMPFARVIQPPRTGKTVLMCEFVAATGATALILVPNKTLVEQTARKVKQQLPGVAVGKYYGDERRPMPSGITVATYRSVEKHFHEGRLPKSISQVHFVFCDEGHRSMSDLRMSMLNGAFSPDTVRVAFTATPNFDDTRMLQRFFPVLIHEITLEEALAMGLLAPSKAWVLQVDVDASEVEIRSGKFDSDTLARVMSAAPVFEAARVVRYQTDDNADKSALMTCSNRQQAYDLYKYLMTHRPAGSKPPKLILQNTKDREELLAAFEAGSIDTLICVRVLIEGWDSARCKLLVDLAPSLSRVVAEQKFLRPMTKDGDEEARIYLLMPKGLKRLPVFPQDLFGQSLQLFGFDDFFAKFARKRKKTGQGRKQRLKRHGVTPVESAQAQTTTLLEGYVRPTLQRHDHNAIRDVIATGLTVTDRLPARAAFSRALFEHADFHGYGVQLMRFCGIAERQDVFLEWMATLYPEAAANVILRAADLQKLGTEPSVFDDWDYICSKAGRVNRERMEVALRALSVLREDPMTPEELLVEKRKLDALKYARDTYLTDRMRFVLDGRYERGLTLSEVGEEMGASRERVRQIQSEAIHRLRHYMMHFLRS